MRLSSFVEGLNTLLPYYQNKDGYHIGSEYDQFYAYKTDIPLPPQVVQKMLDLGWFQPEGDDDTYDPEYAWSAFT